MNPFCLLIIAPILAVAALAADSSSPAAAPPQLLPAPGNVAPPAVQADPAAIEAALKALHFDEMIDKGLGQQKQMFLGMARQAVTRMSGPGVSKEDVAAFPEKTVDAAWAGLSPEEVHAIAMRNYGQVFTTEELRGIADFFNSPAGHALASKEPQVQQKIMAELRPRLFEARRKIQELTGDFTKQQLDKAKAVAEAAAATAKTNDQKAPVAAPATGASSAPAAAPAPAPAAPPKS